MKTPYKGTSPSNGNGTRRPGRPKGSRNQSDHRAGRPRNGNERIKACLVTDVGPAQMRATMDVALANGVITPEELLREVQYIALSDIAEWPDCPESYRNAPVGFRRSISSLTIIKTRTTTKDGTVIEREEIKPTFWNKPQAHDQLLRFHGLYAKDKTPVNIQNNTQYNVDMDVQLDLSKLDTAEIALLENLLGRAGAGREVLDLLPLPDGLAPGGL